MFCSLADNVTFSGDYDLVLVRPNKSNTRSYDLETDEYTKPNGRLHFVKCDPVRDIQDLLFPQRDYATILSFFLDHVGKVIQYTDHYGVDKQAIFTRGLQLEEQDDDCLYLVKVQIQCFPLAE